MTKPKLLFISGLCFSADLFKYQAAYFKDSAHCKTYLPRYNTMAKNVDNLLTLFKGKFSIMAHSSLGAGIALAAAAIAPDRIDKLICLPGWVKVNSYTREFVKESLHQIQQGGFDLFKQTLRNIAVGEKTPNRDKILGEIKAIQDDVPLAQAIQQCQLLLNDLDVTDHLSQVMAPTLIIHNIANDPFLTQEDVDRLIAQLPNARTSRVENSSHLLPYTQPKAVNALSEFWLTSDEKE